MSALESRITVNPEQCGGRPCIRGMRIRVTDVLDLLASGLTPEQVLAELPDLEPEDIYACLRFASRRLEHPVVVSVPAQMIFNHVQARLRFRADVFWTKASINAEILNLWLDTYQTGKDFKRRGIVEVTVS